MCILYLYVYRTYVISPFTRTHAYKDNASNTRAPRHFDSGVVLLFVVNMDTLNTFRRVGYTEAIARHYRNANLQYIMRSLALYVGLVRRLPTSPCLSRFQNNRLERRTLCSYRSFQPSWFASLHIACCRPSPMHIYLQWPGHF